MIKIQLNGQSQTISPETNLEQLILGLKLTPEVVVAEVNEKIIKQKHWAETKLSEGDILELVSFVGGG